MVEGMQWCWPGEEQETYCLCRDGSDTTLCGREVGVIPVLLQPVVPPVRDKQCPVCRRRMYGSDDYNRPHVKRDQKGHCPVCEGLVGVEDGLVVGHQKWVMGSGGPYQSGGRCVGVNLPPKPRRKR